MAQLIAEATYGSYYYASDAVYATAQAAANATGRGVVPAVGQESTATGPLYVIYRGGLEFDTSSIPLSAGITAAALSLYGLTDSTVNDFDLTVVDGTDLANPREIADYGDLLDDITSGGTINTSTWSITGYNDITLNAAGLAMIVKGGTTKFGFRSSKDISATAPTLGDAYDEWIEFYGQDATYPAKLTITYFSGEGQGIIAIVETRLHYVDAYGTERYIQGTAI